MRAGEAEEMSDVSGEGGNNKVGGSDEHTKEDRCLKK